VLDYEPRNETAWVWLSYVVDTFEDRQICLENVLTINPNNKYAQRGLNQLRELTVTRLTAKPEPVRTTKKTNLNSKSFTPLSLVIAFWTGVGILFLLLGLFDLVSWGIEISQSRYFPRYITTYQLMTLAIAITFFIVGVVASNLAWALYKRHKSGYYVSVLLSLSLTLITPIALLIATSPNYLLVAFAAVTPAVILLLTLLSQTNFIYDQHLVAHPRRN
jgi:hypothetical protein